MLNLRREVFYLLLVLYIVYGTYLIRKYIFHHNLSGIRYGLVAAALFVTAYPVFGRKRNSPWPWLGRWSFAKWLLAAIGIGILVTVVDAFSLMVTHYFSS